MTQQQPTGTLAYMAPEVIVQKNKDGTGYDFSCDIWSLGVVLFTMVFGTMPYNMSKFMNILHDTDDGKSAKDGLSDGGKERKDLIK